MDETNDNFEAHVLSEVDQNLNNVVSEASCQGNTTIRDRKHLMSGPGGLILHANKAVSGASKLKLQSLPGVDMFSAVQADLQDFTSNLIPNLHIADAQSMLVEAGNNLLNEGIDGATEIVSNFQDQVQHEFQGQMGTAMSSGSNGQNFLNSQVNQSVNHLSSQANQIENQGRHLQGKIQNNLQNQFTNAVGRAAGQVNNGNNYANQGRSQLNNLSAQFQQATGDNMSQFANGFSSPAAGKAQNMLAAGMQNFNTPGSAGRNLMAGAMTGIASASGAQAGAGRGMSDLMNAGMNTAQQMKMQTQQQMQQQQQLMHPLSLQRPMDRGSPGGEYTELGQASPYVPGYGGNSATGGSTYNPFNGRAVLPSASEGWTGETPSAEARSKPPAMPSANSKYHKGSTVGVTESDADIENGLTPTKRHHQGSRVDLATGMLVVDDETRERFVRDYVITAQKRDLTDFIWQRRWCFRMSNFCETVSLLCMGASAVFGFLGANGNKTWALIAGIISTVGIVMRGISHHASKESKESSTKLNALLKSLNIQGLNVLVNNSEEET